MCYENGDQHEFYPLLESAYKCSIDSSEYALIDNMDLY